MAHFVIGWLRNTSYYLFGSGSSGLGRILDEACAKRVECKFNSLRRVAIEKRDAVADHVIE